MEHPQPALERAPGEDMIGHTASFSEANESLSTNASPGLNEDSNKSQGIVTIQNSPQGIPISWSMPLTSSESNLLANVDTSNFQPPEESFDTYSESPLQQSLQCTSTELIAADDSDATLIADSQARTTSPVHRMSLADELDRDKEGVQASDSSSRNQNDSRKVERSDSPVVGVHSAADASDTIFEDSANLNAESLKLENPPVDGCSDNNGTDELEDFFKSGDNYPMAENLDLSRPELLDDSSPTSNSVVDSGDGVDETLYDPSTSNPARVESSSGSGVVVEMPVNTMPDRIDGKDDDDDEWENLDDVDLPLNDVASSKVSQPYDDEDAVDETPPLSARSVNSVGKKTQKRQAFSSKEDGSILDAFETKPAPTPVSAEESPAATVTKQATRSLRPGGMKNSPALSISRETEKKPLLGNFVYSKDKIMSLAPKRFGDRPQCLSCYDVLYGQDHRKQRHNDERSSRQVPSQQEDWRRVRDTASRRWKDIAGPMPKKQITDPTEIISRQVQDILNKITPQTFEKLTDKLCDIPMNTNEHLDLMINKVFEKAIQEPNFSHLYAELCKALEERSASWAFVQVVYVKDANQFIWIKDIPMNDEFYAGPYHSIQDCISSAESVNTPEPVKPPGVLEIHKLIAVGNLLIKVNIPFDQCHR